MKRDIKIKKFFPKKIVGVFTAVKKVKKLSWISGIILFISGILIILRFADVWQVFLSNTDNARYFLSTVAQALAALFALVITVSLIIMQLLTSTYTSAVFEIYIKRIKIPILFFVQSSTIILSLIVLLRLQNQITCKLEGALTDIVLVLTGLSVIWNIVYFYDLLNIIKPKNFLEMMNKKLLKSSDKQEMISIIGEVCTISIQKGDFSTSKECLNIFNSIFNKLNEKETTFLFDTLEHIFTKAIENDSSEIIYSTLETSVYLPMSSLSADSDQPKTHPLSIELIWEILERIIKYLRIAIKHRNRTGITSVIFSSIETYKTISSNLKIHLYTDNKAKFDFFVSGLKLIIGYYGQLGSILISENVEEGFRTYIQFTTDLLGELDFKDLSDGTDRLGADSIWDSLEKIKVTA